MLGTPAIVVLKEEQGRRRDGNSRDRGVEIHGVRDCIQEVNQRETWTNNPTCDGCNTAHRFRKYVQPLVVTVLATHALYLVVPVSPRPCDRDHLHRSNLPDSSHLNNSHVVKDE